MEFTYWTGRFGPVELLCVTPAGVKPNLYGFGDRTVSREIALDIFGQKVIQSESECESKYGDTAI